MEKQDDQKLFGIVSYEVDTYWEEVSPLIERALLYSDGKYKLDDILKGIKSRDLQLWAIARSKKITTVMVTKIICYPQKKSLLMMLYSGDSTKDTSKFLPMIYGWAKYQGCEEVEMFGRPGWEKLLKSENFEKTFTVLRTKL